MAISIIMNKIHLIVIICIICISYSCNPDLATSYETSIEIMDSQLVADGKSFTKISLDLGENLPLRQEVEITTTNGTLHSLPLDSNFVGNKTLKLTPGGRKVEFFLKSSTLVEEAVVSYRINQTVGYEVIHFSRSCPTEIFLEVRLNENLLIVDLLLLSTTGLVSSNTKIETTVTDSSNTNIINTYLPSFADSTRSQFQYDISMLDSGSYYIKLNSINTGCETISSEAHFDLQ